MTAFWPRQIRRGQYRNSATKSPFEKVYDCQAVALIAAAYRVIDSKIKSMEKKHEKLRF